MTKVDFAAEVSKLVRYISENYKTTLPDDYVPSGIFMDRKYPLFRSFIESLKDAEVDEVGCLNVDFRFMNIKHGKLMIRKTYIDLAQKYFENMKSRFVLQASQGHGNSFFGFFIMFLLVKAGHIHEGVNYPFMFKFKDYIGLYSQGKLNFVYESHEDELLKEFEDYRIALIFNPLPPGSNIPVGLSIIYSSEKFGEITDYSHGGGKVLKCKLDLWSDAELEHLNTIILKEYGGQLSSEELEDRKTYLGSAPRRLFLTWKQFEEALDDPKNEGHFLNDLRTFKKDAFKDLKKGLKEMQLVALNKEAREFNNGGPVLDLDLPKICGAKRMWTVKDIDPETEGIWDSRGKYTFVDAFFTLPGKGIDAKPLVIGFFATTRKSRPIDYAKLCEIYERFGRDFILVWILDDCTFPLFNIQPQMHEYHEVHASEYLPVPQFKLDLTNQNKRSYVSDPSKDEDDDEEDEKEEDSSRRQENDSRGKHKKDKFMMSLACNILMNRYKSF